MNRSATGTANGPTELAGVTTCGRTSCLLDLESSRRWPPAESAARPHGRSTSRTAPEGAARAVGIPNVSRNSRPDTRSASDCSETLHRRTFPDPMSPPVPFVLPGRDAGSRCDPLPDPSPKKGTERRTARGGITRGTTETAAPVAIIHLPRVIRCPAGVATFRAGPQRPTSEDRPRIDPLRRCPGSGLTPSPLTCSRRLRSPDAEAPAQPFLLRPVPQATQTCIAISAGVATLGAASGSRGACVHDRRWSPERLHHHGSGLTPPPVWSR